MSKIEKVNRKVQMVTPEDGPINIRFKQHIIGYTRLGKEIKVTPKAHAFFNKPGYVAEYLVPSVTVTIGIGNDHTAELIMTEEAFKALNEGQPIHVSTTREFKRKYDK